MHRRLTFLSLLAVLTASAVASLAGAAPLGSLVAFATPSGSAPFRIASGADGNLWFSDQGTAKAIGTMTPSGAITEFGLPPGSVPRQVRVGADGALWFTDTNPAAPLIGRVDPSGAITTFALPAGSFPNALALGADGNLWFTDRSVLHPAIGQITPSGVIHEYSTGLNPGSAPVGITPAADGFLWFTDQGTTRAIGRVQTSASSPALGAIQEFNAGLNAGSLPAAITTAVDGVLWFTDQGTPRAIGRVTPAGSITESAAGLIAGSRPIEITPGADGSLWFSDQASPTRALGQLTPTGTGWTVVNYPLPAGTLPGGIRTGSDGNLWFLDNNPAAQHVARFGVGAPPASSAIGVSGGGNLGATQVCEDSWSDWAGQQPSRTALGFDGYQWLRDGAAIVGQTGRSYVPTAADVGHGLSCKVTVTYTLFPTTVSATSAAVVVLGAAEQLAGLANDVAGVGPGRSLAAKVANAQAALERGDMAGTCALLDAFAHEVDAQTGKKLSAGTAASLLDTALRIETVLAC